MLDFKTIEQILNTPKYLLCEKYKLEFLNKNQELGLLTIINEELRNSGDVTLTELDKADIYQWLEYLTDQNFFKKSSNKLNNSLKELDELMSTRTYFLTTKLSIIDYIFYHYLLPIYSKYEAFEKSQLVNLSRWFDNMQQMNLTQIPQINFNLNQVLA